MTTKIITVILIYEIIRIGTIDISVSAFIMPLWLLLGDVITETYGYQITKRLIWMSIICQCAFAFLSYGALHVSSLKGPLQESYLLVLGNLPRIALSSSIAIVTGAFLNAFIISKTKILFRGRHFFLRSLAASTSGELGFTIVAYFLEFFGSTPTEKMFSLMLSSYLIKVLLNPIFGVLTVFVSVKLKAREGIDQYDTHVNYNPFCFDHSINGLPTSEN